MHSVLSFTRYREGQFVLRKDRRVEAHSPKEILAMLCAATLRNPSTHQPVSFNIVVQVEEK